MKRRITPAWALFFLAPAVGELLSGSSPPLQFFNPFSLLVLGCLYGSGALLIRELAHRWHKGWTTIFLLGLAYGIIEEALAVESWFNPGWGDLGVLAVVGRWAGVNWVWAMGLTLYHAAISISIPILLTTLLFPAERETPWLSNRWFNAHIVLFIADIILCFFAIGKYAPPVAPYLLACLMVFLLYQLARRAKGSWPLVQPNTLPAAGARRGRWFYALGFFGTVGLFFCLWVLPNTTTPALIIMLIMALVVIAVRWLAKRMSKGVWSIHQQFMLAAGSLLFFILLTPIEELNHVKPNNGGMMLVGLAFALFLFWLARRTRPSGDPESSLAGQAASL